MQSFEWSGGGFEIVAQAHGCSETVALTSQVTAAVHGRCGLDSALVDVCMCIRALAGLYALGPGGATKGGSGARRRDE